MKRVEYREQVTFLNGEEKIFGVIHRPLKTSKAPAILFCSGLGGNKCGKNDFYVFFARELAQLGFIVLRFDYRATGDSEGNSETITLEDKVSDTVKALEYLTKDPQVDSDHIGILARSLGGAIAILASQYYPYIKSLVLWAPVYSGKQWLDLWKLSKKSEVSDSVINEVKVSSQDSPNEQFLQQIFKLDLKDHLQILQETPLLHIHGDLDTVVKPMHADAYQQICKNFKTTKFIRLPQTEHDFITSSELGVAVYETSEWFKNTLT